MPYFAWFGVLGMVLLYAAGIAILAAKRKNKPKPRRYHQVLGTGAAVSLTVHAVWANLEHVGQAIPIVGWVGLAALGLIFFGYGAASRAKKKRDKKWSELHWKVELAALVVASIHGAWFIWRIIQSKHTA